MEALCVEWPVYDLVIDNIPGVRDASDPDFSLKPSINLTKLDLVDQVDETGAQENGFEFSEEFSGAVETRTQKAREGKHTYLQVENHLSSASVTELKETKEAESSLGAAKLAKGKSETYNDTDAC